MKETKIRCDKCGKIPEDIGRPKCIEVSVAVGKSSDPSGNGYQTDMKHLDLCVGCIGNIIGTAIEFSILDTNLNFIHPPAPKSYLPV